MFNAFDYLILSYKQNRPLLGRFCCCSYFDGRLLVEKVARLEETTRVGESTSTQLPAADADSCARARLQR